MALRPAQQPGEVLRVQRDLAELRPRGGRHRRPLHPQVEAALDHHQLQDPRHPRLWQEQDGSQEGPKFSGEQWAEIDDNQSDHPSQL